MKSLRATMLSTGASALIGGGLVRTVFSVSVVNQARTAVTTDTKTQRKAGIRLLPKFESTKSIALNRQFQRTTRGCRLNLIAGNQVNPVADMSRPGFCG